MKAREGVWERQTERGCARRGGEATVRVTEDRSGATVVPAAPLDPNTHTPSFFFVFVVHTMDAMSGAMQLSRG